MASIGNVQGAALPRGVTRPTGGESAPALNLFGASLSEQERSIADLDARIEATWTTLQGDIAEVMKNGYSPAKMRLFLQRMEQFEMMLEERRKLRAILSLIRAIMTGVVPSPSLLRELAQFGIHIPEQLFHKRIDNIAKADQPPEWVQGGARQAELGATNAKWASSAAGQDAAARLALLKSFVRIYEAQHGFSS